MKKPAAEEIRKATSLTMHAMANGFTGVTCCNVCGGAVDATDLPVSAWREHDERDRPILGRCALVFLGPVPWDRHAQLTGSSPRPAVHATCKKTLDEHPRLYAEEAGEPGCFPRLCGDCSWRDGIVCRHPDLKENDGRGLLVAVEGLNAIICTRGGVWSPVRHAVRCDGWRKVASGGGG